MKVAITAWEDKISPVFDSARMLLIADIKNTEILSRCYESFNPEKTSSLVDALGYMGIDVLICGAISEMPAKIIEASGINLIPFIGGKLEEVLVSYATGRRIVPTFLMPGCGRKRNRTRKRKFFSDYQQEVETMPKGDRTGPQGQGAGTGKGRGGCKPGGKGGKGTGRGVGRGTGQGKGGGQSRGN